MTCTGQDRCQIIEYSTLSEGSCSSKFSQVIFFFYCSCTWAVQSSIPFGYLHLLLQDHSLFSGEELNGVRDKVRRYHMFDVRMLLEAFLGMSLRATCLIDEVFFSVKKQSFQPWDYSPQMPDHQDF